MGPRDVKMFACQQFQLTQTKKNMFLVSYSCPHEIRAHFGKNRVVFARTCILPRVLHIFREVSKTPIELDAAQKFKNTHFVVNVARVHEKIHMYYKNMYVLSISVQKYTFSLFETLIFPSLLTTATRGPASQV